MARMTRGGKAADGDKFAKGYFRDQSVRTVAKAKVIEGRIERLLTEERVERPGLTWQMKLDFGATVPSGQDVLMLEGLSAGCGAPLFSGVNEVLRAGERLALVGPNGAGKTTLLRVVTGELAPLAGRARLGASVRLGYLSQEQTGLDPEASALEAIRAVAPVGETEARTFLHRFLFTGDDVFVPAAALSYGERARLALACLVAGGCNFLLLDEPINHLDIPSRERFEQAIGAFGGTVLAVVHDRYFIRRFAGRIWLLMGGALRTCYDLEDLEAKWRAAAWTYANPKVGPT
jgi:ATP-binding cassette subfamily F protein 3